MANTSGAIRAGRAFVEMFADTTQLEAAINRVSARLKTFGANISKSMGKFGSWTRGNASLPGPLQAIADFAMSPAGITTGMSMLTMKAAEYGDELSRMSQRTGIAVDTLSKLKFAADMMDVPFQDLIGTIGKMQKVIATDKGGMGALLGLSTEGQFLAAADMIAAIENPAMRAAKAMEIFGKSGASLLPFLGEGSEKIREMMDEAERLGFTADPAEIEKLAQADDAFKRMNLSIANLINTVGAELAPVFTKMADSIGALVRYIRDFAKNNEGALQTIYRVVTAITGIGAAASILAVVMPSIAPIIGGAFAFIGSMIAAIMSPVGLVVAAIVGLGAGFGLLSGMVRRAMDSIWSDLQTLAREIGMVFNGAFDAIVGGDFELAWQIVRKGFELAWAQTVNALKEMWNGFVDSIGFVLSTVYKIWPKMVYAAKAAWMEFGGWFEKMWNSLLVNLSKAFGNSIASVVESIGNALDGVWGMGTAGQDLKNAATNIRNNLTYRPARTDAQIDADTADKKDTLRAERDAAIAATDATVMELLANIKAATDPAEIARLYAELEALIARAADLPEGQKGKRFNPGIPLAMQGAGVAGTFSGAALSGLGMGSPMERLIGKAEEQRRLLEEQNRLHRDMNNKMDSYDPAIQLA